ncbi:hypothetical protein XPN_0038 [Xanthomonas arboricola pv. pruni MAFF 301427]|nr:hypothetical protein XPN_0038 [Xanthomonas arboricola pv. pruni MAFF 301427]
MNLRTSAVRLGLLPAGIAIALTPAFAANAQEQSAAPSTTTLDRIEITGSRIRSVDVETAQPVFTVTQQDIQKSGLVSVGDILQNLSIAGTQTYSKAAVLTSDPEQGGQYVNLYNLNENRTLVLVNGKRWTSSLNGLTDMSTIPSSLIERIEVLKDGASAIYAPMPLPVWSTSSCARTTMVPKPRPTSARTAVATVPRSSTPSPPAPPPTAPRWCSVPTTPMKIRCGPRIVR